MGDVKEQRLKSPGVAFSNTHDISSRHLQDSEKTHSVTSDLMKTMHDIYQ